MLIAARIEDGYAVIEDGDRRIEVPASMLAEDVVEGDAVILSGSIYIADKKASAEARSEVIKLQNELWE